MNSPVLILGGGINGAAIARELVLNGVSVWLVDQADVASGATAYSSRLIHGGLRYLEFGEFDLVRESLAERSRLLRLAPQFVHPLKLFIPVRHRVRGWLTSAARFCGLPGGKSSPERGLWLVRTGLWLYDRFANDRTLPRHEVHPLGENTQSPPVNQAAYRWVCSYFDAQIDFPERLVQSLLQDARQATAQSGVEFRVFTYHSASLQGAEIVLVPNSSGQAKSTTATGTVSELDAIRLQPAAILNATGAWVDETLQKLPLDSERLMGGTKGSHLFTFHAGLAETLSAGGIYTEASDGRPVFLLPLAGGVLIGTTDLPFTEDPATAVASETEIEYLLACVNHVFPQVRLKQEDIAWHYSGVRPLPFVDASSTAGITRRHAIKEHPAAPVPFYSVIGGKLTTCRSLAEETARVVLARLGRGIEKNSRQRQLPGGEEYPQSESKLVERQQSIAERHQLSLPQVAALWKLWGTRAESVAAFCVTHGLESIPGTDLPRGTVAWCVEHEWAVSLEDLIERRLMLLYEPGLCEKTMESLAEELIAWGRLAREDRATAIRLAVERLRGHFGWKAGGKK